MPANRWLKFFKRIQSGRIDGATSPIPGGPALSIPSETSATRRPEKSRSSSWSSSAEWTETGRKSFPERKSWGEDPLEFRLIPAVRSPATKIEKGSSRCLIFSLPPSFFFTQILIYQYVHH